MIKLQCALTSEGIRMERSEKHLLQVSRADGISLVTYFTSDLFPFINKELLKKCSFVNYHRIKICKLVSLQ
jgi:hypothetical protein